MVPYGKMLVPQWYHMVPHGTLANPTSGLGLDMFMNTGSVRDDRKHEKYIYV